VSTSSNVDPMTCSIPMSGSLPRGRRAGREVDRDGRLRPLVDTKSPVSAHRRVERVVPAEQEEEVVPVVSGDLCRNPDPTTHSTT